MNLAAEQQLELARFPAALQALVAAELAAGNGVLEIHHSHPAPPVGACVLLAKPVSTRPRASGAGLSFYERNSSLHSGEFTDAARHYFVLEAPKPPPPEPDMDALRQAPAPKPDTLAQLAPPEPAHAAVAGPEPSRAPAKPQRPRGRKTESRRASAVEFAPAQAELVAESATGWTRVVTFRDPHPPHRVQFAWERELMVLFTAAMDGGQLRLAASANVNGAHYAFELRYVAAREFAHDYTLRTTVSWAHTAPEHYDYFRQTSDSWFAMWTRDLKAATTPIANETAGEAYSQHCAAALQAQQELDSVPAVQRAIVEGMKQGGTFHTSHKEGGTNIGWQNGKFFRSDYGDFQDSKIYADEAEFLQMLRQFCQGDITRHAAQAPLSDLDAWKLILRRLNPAQ